MINYPNRKQNQNIVTKIKSHSYRGANLEDDLNLRARIVLSSGSEGRVSDTAPNSKNSIFASSFINILRTAQEVSLPLSMTDIGLNVKRSFIGNPNQKPYYYHPDTWTHLGGDFLFIAKK